MATVQFSEALQLEVAAITRHLTQRAEGGLQPTELLTVLFSCVNVMSSVGVRFLNVPAPEQQVEVTRTVKAIYDGMNPDLPWIGEPFESMIENALFQYLVPVLYTVLFRSKVAEQEARQSAANADEPVLLQKLRAAYETEEGKAALAPLMVPESHTMMSEDNNAQGGEVEYASQSREDDEAAVPGQSGT